MPSDSYLTDLQCQEESANYSTDVGWAVLDAIEAAGPAGADVESLALQTRYDDTFLAQALRNLRNSGMAWTTAEMRYRVTSLGETARSLAAY